MKPAVAKGPGERPARAAWPAGSDFPPARAPAALPGKRRARAGWDAGVGRRGPSEQPAGPGRSCAPFCPWFLGTSPAVPPGLILTPTTPPACGVITVLRSRALPGTWWGGGRQDLRADCSCCPLLAGCPGAVEGGALVFLLGTGVVGRLCRGPAWAAEVRGPGQGWHSVKAVVPLEGYSSAPGGGGAQLPGAVGGLPGGLTSPLSYR